MVNKIFLSIISIKNLFTLDCLLYNLSRCVCSSISKEENFNFFVSFFEIQFQVILLILKNASIKIYFFNIFFPKKIFLIKILVSSFKRFFAKTLKDEIFENNKRPKIVIDKKIKIIFFIFTYKISKFCNLFSIRFSII